MLFLCLNMAAEFLVLHRLKGKICERLENCCNEFIQCNFLARCANYSNDNYQNLICYQRFGLPKI